MTFTKRLSDGVRRGEMTCSVHIWTRSFVKVGGRYRMEEGEIEVDSIEPIRSSGHYSSIDRVSLALSISSRRLTKVEAGTFTWCVFITCARAANSNREEHGVPAVRNRRSRNWSTSG